MTPQKTKSGCACDSWNGKNVFLAISAIWKAHLIRGCSIHGVNAIVCGEWVGIQIFPAFMVAENTWKNKELKLPQWISRDTLLQ